jgi:hypothetical protein
MSDLQVLLCVLVGLYASECVVAARRGSVVFRLPWFFGAASADAPSRSLGNANIGLLLLNPLPPFGRVYVTEPWPFVCDDTSVVAAQATSFGRDPKPAQTGRRLAFADIVDVGSVDADVLVNGAVFATSSSAAHAQAAATALRVLWQAAPSERAAVRQRLLRAACDVADVRARVQRHRVVGQPALWASVGAFAAMFVVTPIVVSREGVERWALWLGLIYVWVAVAAVAVFVAFRALRPTAVAERRVNFALSLCAPTVAMRGNDKLGRSLLAGLHPVAAALVLLRGSTKDVVVGALLRDLRQPRLPTVVGNDAVSVAIEADFRSELLAVCKAVAADADIDVDAAFVATGTTATYCPRCHVGYIKGSVCADCGGVPLVARPASTVD